MLPFNVDDHIRSEWDEIISLADNTEELFCYLLYLAQKKSYYCFLITKGKFQLNMYLVITIFRIRCFKNRYNCKSQIAESIQCHVFTLLINSFVFLFHCHFISVLFIYYMRVVYKTLKDVLTWPVFADIFIIINLVHQLNMLYHITMCYVTSQRVPLELGTIELICIQAWKRGLGI